MGSSSSETVGFKYHMGVQLGLTHGPVDKVMELIGEENIAWQGEATDNTTVTVNAPNLFGGEKREGGWVGMVDIAMGRSDQPANPYLVAKIAGPVPAYRGLLTTTFRGESVGGGKSFLWSSGNPYFKSPWWRIARYIKGWSREGAWYPAKAKIGRDMNPAHIIYECLTNLEWGMGYSPSDIDDVSFTAVADKLFAEGFGLSLLWMEATSINDFVGLILKHVDGNIRSNLYTGLFEIRLVRNDYVAADITKELGPSNIIQFQSFQRKAWGDTANEVVVKYTDRYQNTTTVAVHDLASIEAQGAISSVTRDYPGIREDELANRVAMRDLHNVSTPIAQLKLTCNRVAWDWDVTDVFMLNWPKRGIDRVPFRIMKIIKGDLINGVITIEAIEDIFGMPDASYVATQPPGWVDPIQEPVAAPAMRAMEVPYWDIVRNSQPSDMAFLPTDYGFGQVLAVKPSGDYFNFESWAAPAPGGPYNQIGAGTFSPIGLLSAEMPKGAGSVVFNLVAASELDSVELNSYAYVDNEALLVTAIDIETAQVTASRATLDTIPAVHLAGARVYFSDNGYAGYDITQRDYTETVFYKPLTINGRGQLDIDDTGSASVTLNLRAQRPYPPANVRILGLSFPVESFGENFTVTWAHRDRLQQTVDLVPFTAGNIGPEPGTTYTVALWTIGGSLIRTTSAIAGTSWTYSPADEAADGYLQEFRVRLNSQREGLSSWQTHDITIDRHGLGFHLGEDLGGVSS